MTKLDLTRNLLTISPYSPYPPRSGGTKRIFNLNLGYAALGWKVRQISGATMQQGVLDLLRFRRREIAPYYLEDFSFNPLIILGNRLLRTRETAQIAGSLLPRFLRPAPLIRAAMANSKIVLFEHPHFFDMAAPWLRDDHFVILDAHNVETEIYAHLLDDSGVEGRAARALERVERACLARADLVFACSSIDREKMVSRFDVGADRVHVAPNGVDLTAIPFFTETQRAQAKHKLGFAGNRLALFVGTRWAPNMEAARHVIEIAGSNPDFIHVIAGSVGDGLGKSNLPGNVIITGSVEELNPWFAAADIALNPMESGSGSNIKMFEYCAAGLPVLTTRFGMRGVEDSSGRALIVSEVPNMPQALGALMMSPDLDQRRADARLVAEQYSWSAIARQISDTITETMAHRMPSTSLH